MIRNNFQKKTLFTSKDLRERFSARRGEKGDFNAGGEGKFLIQFVGKREVTLST